MNERIKILRNKLNLTQREFAEKIGLKVNTIAVYEMGVRNPRNSTILVICREFNVNEEWLRTGKGEIFLSIGQSILTPNTIGERVREVRLYFRMSMEDFGNRLGVGKTSISCIENSKHSVTNQMFLSICREFNINEEWLRDGSGDMLLNSNSKDSHPLNIRERIIGAVTIMDDCSVEKLWDIIRKNQF